MRLLIPPRFFPGAGAVIITLFSLLSGGAFPPAGDAGEPWANNGAGARAVWGQPDYETAVPGQSARHLNRPDSIATDPGSGKVFVSDAGNHRVLRFASFAALASGAPAEAVLGQADFTTVVPAGTRSRMDSPKGISVDGQGRLWVADANNHRVLRFDNASTKITGANADGVLGQPDFTSTDATGGPAGMGYVTAVLADTVGRIWVSDWDNRRVTRFDNAAAKINGANADAVLGQPDFDTNREATDQTSLRSPAGLALDAAGNLWVADIFQARVMMFRNAAAKPDGGAADLVLGQLEFGTANMNLTSWGLSQPSGLAIDRDGNLWVTDQLFHRVLRYEDPASAGHGAGAAHILGQPHFEIADWGTSRNSLNVPEGIRLSQNGELWVADRENHRLLKFGPTRFRPDGWIGSKRGEMRGDDLYTNSGEGQEIDLEISATRTRKFYFTAQNDGNVADDLRVRGSRKNRKVAVKYFRLTRPRENVTGKMTRLGQVISNLEPGSFVRFKAQVTAAHSETGLGRDVAKTLRILTSSESNGSKDKAKVRAATPSPPVPARPGSLR